MMGTQFDLFAGPSPVIAAMTAAGEPEPDAASLSELELIERLPDARIGACGALVDEVVRRQPAGGVAALRALCLRHAGFGRERVVPQQAAAIAALAAIGGDEASQALGDLIAAAKIEGPALAPALAAAARLGSRVPDGVLAQCLRHDLPGVRAAAARCVRHGVTLIPLLAGLLDDLHDDVRVAAACALGTLGRAEARAVLMRALQEQPTEAVIAALAPIHDKDIIVLLGRVPERRPDLTPAVLLVLEDVDHPRAAKVAARLRGLQLNQ